VVCLEEREIEGKGVAKEEGLEINVREREEAFQMVVEGRETGWVKEAWVMIKHTGVCLARSPQSWQTLVLHPCSAV